MLFAGVMSTALLASCNEASPSVTAPEESSAEMATLPSGENASTKALAVDPVTAVSAGLSIASSLKSLFGKDSDQRNLKEIKAKLNEISAQNSQILARLGEITSILKNLGAIVRENVRLETIFEKQARLSGESAQLYETWLAEIDDRRARRQAEQRYRNDILPDVRDVTSQLMDEGYGYSAYDTVGHGMLMEFWMSRRLGERASLRQSKASSYIAYFDRALDPAIAGSPGKLLADAQAQQARLKAILDAADKRIGSEGWEVKEREYQTSKTRGRETKFKRIAVFAKVTGDQASGYALSRREVVVREWVEYDDWDGPRCPACMNIETPSGSEKGLSPDPVAGADTPAARAPYWNDVRAVMRQAQDEIATWSKVGEAIRIYSNEARAVRASG